MRTVRGSKPFTLSELPDGSSSEPVDPARLVAESLLEAALAADPEAAAAARERGSVVVMLTPSEWCEEIARAWRQMLTHERGADQEGPEDEHPDSVCRRMEEPHYIVRTKEDPDLNAHDRVRMEERLENAQKAIWQGIGLYAVVPRSDLLPASFVRNADVTIVIKAPGERQAEAAAVHCQGGPVPWAIGAILAPLTPDHFRSAFRPTWTAKRCYSALLAEARDYMDAVSPPTTTKPEKPVWRLEQLHGMPEVTAFGRSLAADVAAWRAGRIAWSDLPPGVMLCGPPGTGKTTVARCIAEHAQMSYVVTSFSEWESADSGRLNSTIKFMREAFEKARKQSPCLLFIDELDTLPRRGDGNPNDNWWTAVTNSLLSCFTQENGDRGEIIVVGAANSISSLDPALLRSGRLDRVIHVGLPDLDGLKGILREHLGADLPRSDIGPAARLLLGGTGADAEQAVRSARRSARAAGRPVEMADLMAAVGEEGTPPRVVSVHEAGHVVVHDALRPGSVLSASLVRRGINLGGVEHEVGVGETTSERIHDLLTGMLAGRAAEEVLIGRVTSGSGGGEGSDLAQATTLAAGAELSGGLGSTLVWHGELTQSRVAELVVMRPALADLIEKRLAAAYADALRIVRGRRAEVEAVAVALLDRRVLVGNEIAEVIAAVRRTAGQGRGDAAVVDRPDSRGRGPAL